MAFTDSSSPKSFLAGNLVSSAHTGRIIDFVNLGGWGGAWALPPAELFPPRDICSTRLTRVSSI